MQLKGREAVATMNVMRCVADAAAVPLKGVWRFLGGGLIRGWLRGSRGRQGLYVVCLAIPECKLYFIKNCAPVDIFMQFL
jgi:hypothetical protein